MSVLIQDVLLKTWKNDPDITLELYWPAQEMLPVLHLFKSHTFHKGHSLQVYLCFLEKHLNSDFFHLVRQKMKS